MEVSIELSIDGNFHVSRLKEQSCGRPGLSDHQPYNDVVDFLCVESHIHGLLTKLLVTCPLCQLYEFAYPRL